MRLVILGDKLIELLTS